MLVCVTTTLTLTPSEHDATSMNLFGTMPSMIRTNLSGTRPSTRSEHDATKDPATRATSFKDGYVPGRAENIYRFPWGESMLTGLVNPKESRKLPLNYYKRYP